MNIYNQLLSELLELEESASHWVLKWVDWIEFDRKMRILEIGDDKTIDKITKEKFEQKQKKIEAISTPRSWYIWWNFLTEWKEFLQIFCWNTYTKKQTYFPPKSEEMILEELGKLFRSAKWYIGMYDNYFCDTFLSLFSANLNELKIEIISNVKVQNLTELLNAFKLLNKNKGIEIRNYNFAHDRFYIIDNRIYSFWTSLQKPDRATLLSELDKEEGEKFLIDFKQWWEKAYNHN